MRKKNHNLLLILHYFQR